MVKEKRTEKEKDEYIHFLEDQVKELKYLNLEKKEDLSTILKIQEEFLIEKYSEKDNLISQNEWLTNEVNRLTRSIAFDRKYIDYLLNSFWWKMTRPFRIISRKIKHVNNNYDFISITENDENLPLFDIVVSVIIFTYNAGEEFSIQLENIIKQNQLQKIEIIIIDKGSSDNTVEIAKKYGATVILSNTEKDYFAEIYSLSKTFGDYIVMIDQNCVVNSNNWLYQSLVPIVHNQANVVAFFKECYCQEIEDLKNSSIYQDLKNRIGMIGNKKAILFPKDRDKVQYINPMILDMTCAIVMKKQ